jgi:hypothetical protein
MAKIDELKKRYPKVTAKTAETFLKGDITPTKKYLEYMFKYWVNTPFGYKLTSAQVVTLVNKFDSLLPYIENKDIYSNEYSNIGRLRQVIEIAEKTKSDNEFIREDHIDVLIENDDFLLLRPKTFEGSNKYGANTRWCTTGRNGSYFSNYTKTSYLFYLVSKKERKHNYNKIAFLIGKKDSLVGNVKTYNQIDSDVATEGTLIQNGWSSFEVFEIISKCRSYVYQESIKDQVKKSVNGVISKLESIDMDEFFKNIEIINNLDGVETDYKNKLGNILETLKSKIGV